MRLLPLALVLFLAASCKRNIVTLEHTNAKGEVQRLVNLTFRFHNAMVPDSLINEWDSTQYVSFTPSIPGRFRWEQPDELVFSPSQPLPPATSFKAQLNDDILAYTKFNRIESDDLKFRTPELKLEDIRVSWVLPDNRAGSPVATADLQFNYAVSPTLLKDKIKIQVDGKVTPYDMISLSGNSRIMLALKGINQLDRDLEATLTIDKGVVPEGGSDPTSDVISTPFSVSSPFNLIINDVSAEHDGLTGIVNVFASQQVSLESISSMLRVEPNVKFTVERTDEGFAIRSEDFNAEKSYLLTIQKGLKGTAGGVLHEHWNNNIAFGEIEPYVRFTNSKSVYLSAAGNRMIEIRMANVPSVKVVISRIYESNLLAARQYGYYPRDTESDDNDYSSDHYAANTTSFGDVVYEKELDARSLPRSGNSRLFTFNVEERLPDFKGIYHIQVRSKDNYWISDSRLIAVSDIGLIAKEGREKLIVFANSIKTANPLSGVNIIAYGANNQVLGMAATDKEGVAQIAYIRKEFAGFKPAMIIAKTESDFNYLPFSSTRVNTSRFETGGKNMNASMLDAFIYAERDIYRPGERINFSAIIRDRNWKVPASLPVKFRFLLPNGKELRSFRKSLNEQGSVEGQVEISASAITGTYTLELYTSTDVLLATQNFSIEEFVPDRIKLTTTADRDHLKPGETGIVKVNAVNFFGPPAAERNYEMEIQLRSVSFSSKKYAGYDFSVKNSGLSFDKVVREGRTDEYGNVVERYEVPAIFQNTGLLESNIYATVFDETGRPVTSLIHLPVYTQPVFFGVADDGYWYYPLNQPVKFAIIALDRHQKVLSGVKASIKVIKHEYRTVLSRAGNFFRYDSQKEDKLLSEQTITIGGEKTAYSFVPRSPGNYELRISLPGASGYVSKSFFSYGSWGGDNNSFEVNTEGTIDIESDKSVYKPGDIAKVLFKTPFNGKLLVTVEQDKVLSYQFVNVEKRSATVDVKVNEDHLPNVFITATLLRPHTISDIPLTVAHGFQNLIVQQTSRKNPVQILAAKTSRSSKGQEVTVKAAPGSIVTLAAVDNGVLQVSDFKTPDPYNHFYAARALQVDGYNLYPYLFPEVRGRLSSTGGDAEADMQKRLNPMPAKRIQIVSYWSGITRSNGNGNAKFTIPVPKFSGEIRLMAVAYKDNVFGSAESAIKIADPLVISTALPRFLSPGDSISVPVTITNTTSAAATAVASVSVTGPLKVNGAFKQQLTLNANSEGRVIFSVNASAAIDTGKIYVDVQGAGERFRDQTAIGVRPASPLEFRTGSGFVEGGKNESINIGAVDFIPGSKRIKVIFSRNPLVQSAAQLHRLLSYPYGCTEQVVSSAFPQLYFADLAANVADENEKLNANRNVIDAIRTIKLRQLYNGSLTLWDNEGTENWWTTVYAAHFLLEARKAGFDVEDGLLGTMLNYINARLRNKQTILYSYNRNQRKKIAPKEVAYSLYVLALASRANVPAMNYYKSNSSVLSLDSRYLLSVAYAVAGDKKSYNALLPASFSGEVSVPETGGSFYSPIRDEAIALNALIDIDPGNAQIPQMARHVGELLRDRDWFSTQESAFSLLALGKLAKVEGRSTAVAAIRANGKQVAKFEGREITYKASDPALRTLDILTSGQGRLYYYWQVEGISLSGQYKEEDSYIKVRRQFFDRYGRLVAGNAFKQNDLIIVQVALERAFSTDVNNVVITDIIPSGFEIENPRTRELPGMDWIKDGQVPTSLDVRDDRIHLFVDLTTQRQVYYYAARAVTPGTFKMGPVSADAMYNGDYHSYNGGGTVRINN